MLCTYRYRCTHYFSIITPFTFQIMDSFHFSSTHAEYLQKSKGTSYPAWFGDSVPEILTDYSKLHRSGPGFGGWGLGRSIKPGEVTLLHALCPSYLIACPVSGTTSTKFTPTHLVCANTCNAYWPTIYSSMSSPSRIATALSRLMKSRDSSDAIFLVHEIPLNSTAVHDSFLGLISRYHCAAFPAMALQHDGNM